MRNKENKIKKREDNLRAEIDFIYDKVNYHSYATRKRYYWAELRFVKWLARYTKILYLKNINDFHLKQYVKYLRENDWKESSINMELDAIYYYHKFTKNTRNELPKNKREVM